MPDAIQFMLRRSGCIAFEVTGHVFVLLQLQLQLQLLKLAIAYLGLLKKALQQALQQRLLHAHG